MTFPPQSTLTDKKYQDILQSVRQAGIDLADVAEIFVRGSGHGGQKINKTASAVQLKHLPTGTVVKCQRFRERPLNRLMALRQLAEKLNPQPKKDETAEKIRKQKNRRRRRAQNH